MFYISFQTWEKVFLSPSGCGPCMRNWDPVWSSKKVNFTYLTSAIDIIYEEWAQSYLICVCSTSMSGNLSLGLRIRTVLLMGGSGYFLVHFPWRMGVKEQNDFVLRQNSRAELTTLKFTQIVHWNVAPMSYFMSETFIILLTLQIHPRRWRGQTRSPWRLLTPEMWY